MLNRDSGFTLVELVTVIFLLGILAVSVGPRIFGGSAVSESVLSAQLISLLRNEQTYAMQDVAHPCYGLEYNATTVTALRCDRPSSEFSHITLPDDVRLEVLSGIEGSSGAFYFNGYGCPVSASHTHTSQPCEQGASLEFQLTGLQTQYVCVAAQGYISLGRCQ